jgi:hypothetical protein
MEPTAASVAAEPKWMDSITGAASPPSDADYVASSEDD